jgi:signal transduction histidine kinase
VEDQGPGIPEEIRDRIFQLYFSTKGKGSGIGLAVTFRVVQLHNGTIDFTTEVGRGTTFRLRFPARDREPANARV